MADQIQVRQRVADRVTYLQQMEGLRIVCVLHTHVDYNARPSLIWKKLSYKKYRL